MLVSEEIRLKGRGQRGKKSSPKFGGDLGVCKHVITLACPLGVPCRGCETVERNACQMPGLSTPQYFQRRRL